MNHPIDFTNFLELERTKQMETRDWRNSATVAPFFQIPYISEGMHEGWLSILAKPDPSSIAFLMKHGGVEVGVTYFSKINRELSDCHWGIYIHRPEARGKGIAQMALDFCSGYAKDPLGLKVIWLEVLADNHQAIHVYQKKGFEICETFSVEQRSFLRMKKTL